MKFIIPFLTLIFTVAFAKECEQGYFSKGTDSCNWACSEGCKDNSCNDNGVCTTSECLAGWENSSSDSADCASPICFGGRACAEGGKCVYPNQCICGQSGAQVVAKSGTFEDVNGNEVEGTDCVSLRKDGIKGAFISLVVMCVSISICGGIAEKRGQAK